MAPIALEDAPCNAAILRGRTAEARPHAIVAQHHPDGRLAGGGAPPAAGAGERAAVLLQAADGAILAAASG